MFCPQVSAAPGSKRDGARQEILPGFGFILPAAEAERFVAAVPSAVLAEVDANHYTITTHDDSIAAIGAFPRTR